MEENGFLIFSRVVYAAFFYFLTNLVIFFTKRIKNVNGFIKIYLYLVEFLKRKYKKIVFSTNYFLKQGCIFNCIFCGCLHIKKEKLFLAFHSLLVYNNVRKTFGGSKI